MKTDLLLFQQTQYMMNGDYCESHNIGFVDDECARGSWLASRGAMAMRALPEFDYIINSRIKKFNMLAERLTGLGVQWGTTTPFRVDGVGHGHVNLWCDGVINSGFPDYPQHQMPVIFLSPSKTGLALVEKEGNSVFTTNRAQLLMAVSGMKKCLIINYSDASGRIHFSVVDVNLNKARKIWDTTNKGVESADIPPTLPLVDNDINPKCLDCPFSGVCMAPTVPAATCRSCKNSVFGPNGQLVCTPNNNFNLNPENIVNMHQCSYHRFNKGLIATWAMYEGEENNNVTFSNLLNGNKFVNGKGQGFYTSYEMCSTKGAKAPELIGDKAMNFIKKEFGAKIE